MTRIAFEFRVPATHPALAGHFPGNPVVPGVLLLDQVLHALTQSTGRSVTRLRQVKFMSVLLPGELARGRWQVADSRATFFLGTQRAGVEVSLAEGSGTLSSEGLR